MKNSHIQFYYFSGTGNTKLVVDRMVKVFRENSLTVDLVEIGRHTRPLPSEDCTVGLGFPVAYQSTYPFLWEFFDSLPPARGTQVFMVDTLGGFSGGIVGPLHRLLVSKGYKPIGACEILMPFNFMLLFPRLMLHGMLKRRAVRTAEVYARSLLIETAQWRVVPFWSSFLYPSYLVTKMVLFTGLNQRLFKMRTDSLKCIACGKCANSCPVGTITMTMGRDGRQYPRFGNTCEFCMRCIAVCPNDANSFVLNGGRIYRAKPH